MSLTFSKSFDVFCDNLCYRYGMSWYSKLVYPRLHKRYQLSKYNYENGNNKFSDENGNPFALYDQTTLATELNISIDSVKRAMKELIVIGLVKKIKQGKKQPNKYIVYEPNPDFKGYCHQCKNRKNCILLVDNNYEKDTKKSKSESAVSTTNNNTNTLLQKKENISESAVSTVTAKSESAVSTTSNKYLKEREKYIYTPLPRSEHKFVDIFLELHEIYMKKQHVGVNRKQREYVFEVMEFLETEHLIDTNEFHDSVVEHFERLPKGNNGSILYYIDSACRRDFMLEPEKFDYYQGKKKEKALTKVKK